MLALNAEGISKAYENYSALSFLNLSMEEGSVSALIGEKGCGNVTAANIFCGLVSSTRGSCSLFETSVKDFKNVKTICSFASSQAELYPHLTGLDNLTFIASLFGIDKDTAHQRASMLMKELGIWDYHEILYKDYPENERKLLSLCRAMIHSPKILFLEKYKKDDNIKYNKNLSNFIKNHSKEENLTVCLITDDEVFASENASSFTVLEKGKTICSGTVLELLENYPIKPYAKIKCDKKPEGFTKKENFFVKELENESDFSKILLDLVLSGAKIKSAEFVEPDFETIYKKIMEGKRI